MIGVAPQYQEIQLLDNNYLFQKNLQDDNANLKSYGVETGMILYVIDRDPNSIVKNLEKDETNKTKFELSDETYSKRVGNVRDLKEQAMKKMEEEIISKIQVGM